MIENFAIEAPRVYPTMRCRNAEAMIGWLKDVLGFAEHVVDREGGIVQHAELAFGSSILMLSQTRDSDYDRLAGDLDARRTGGIYVAADDPDALYAKVKAAGARVEMEVHDTDYGSREFVCRDPEGNLWSVGTYWPKVNSG
ncbi:MAG TPA: VOC family protein [Gammaproteobacteria bacterium]|nr:VOC family protein [Gammaproteobacteria bacterium]